MNTLRQGIGGPVSIALRLVAGGALASAVTLAVTSPAVPAMAGATGVAVLLAALIRPDVALVLVAAIAPAGLLLAPEPTRAAELLAWAFLAGWLLRVWRPLSPGGWRSPIALPACLYAAAAIASWLTLTVRGAGGLDPAALPRFVARAIGSDHLAVTSPDAETWAMLLMLCGIATMFAALALVRESPALVRRTGVALVLSLAALSVATLASVIQQWSTHEYAGWFLYQYATSERFAFHVRDLNAAGSQYVLAALAALGFVVFEPARRWRWLAALGPLLFGLWLTGSRTAGVAAAGAGVLVLLAARFPAWRPGRSHLIAAAAAAVILLAAGGAILARGANEPNAAGRAMGLRMQFTQTSARMLAAAPLYGVGVGRYHATSGRYMPEELRALYGFENAHNYFAQQFAELGLIGGALFLWLIVAGLAGGWAFAREHAAIAAGLCAGVVGYTVTCITGHPLLVPEAALPFWIALGVAAGGTRSTGLAALTPARTRLLAIAAMLVLAAPIGLAAATYRQSQAFEQGFYEAGRHEDGTPFRWTTRHAVTYVDARPGFLTFEVRAAEPPGARPFELATEIDGRIVDRRLVPADRWETIELPVRPRPGANAALRRVDFRVSHTWLREQQLGRRMTSLPVGIMVSNIRWTPATQ